MQLKTKGIILKQRNIGENDRIVTILSAELGLIEGSARRAKSTRSPLTGATQLLTYSEFCLFKGKQNYYIIDTAETINSFYSLRLDVVKLALAGYFCELVAYLSPTTDNAEEFLRLLLNCLHFLQQEKRNQEQLKCIFELRALSLAGFMPNLVGCTECGEFEKTKMAFLPLDGVLICSECFPGSGYDREDIIKHAVQAPVLAAMRHVVFSEPERIFSFKLTGASLKQFSRITENYTLLHTEGKFKSLDIYKSLL